MSTIEKYSPIDEKLSGEINSISRELVARFSNTPAESLGRLIGNTVEFPYNDPTKRIAIARSN